VTVSEASDWVDRWRVLRGSPPDPPDDAAFDVIAGMPEDALQDAARATGDDVDRLRWWRSIATDPSRDHLAALRPSQTPVYAALKAGGPMTDDELVLYMGRKKSEVSPRRVELVRHGVVQEVDKRITEAGRKAAVWAVVAAEEVSEARQSARQRGLRRKHLDAYPLDQQVQIVEYLVGKAEVNAALLANQGRSKKKEHARREARRATAERDREQREFNEKVRQAERDASPQLVFLKAVGQIRKAVDAVREIDRVIGENIDSQLTFGYADIASEHWPEVEAELVALAELTAEALREIGRVIDPDSGSDTIDVDYEDAEIIELNPGDEIADVT
jgi:hypothetical protein